DRPTAAPSGGRNDGDRRQPLAPPTFPATTSRVALSEKSHRSPETSDGRTPTLHSRRSGFEAAQGGCPMRSKFAVVITLIVGAGFGRHGPWRSPERWGRPGRERSSSNPWSRRR